MQARLFGTILGLFALVALCACGGSGSDSVSKKAITGTVFASSVSGAAVTAKDMADNTVGGPASTSTAGAFSIDVNENALSGALIFESQGGSYTDEATGASAQAGKLAAYVPEGTLSAEGPTVNLTPSSTIVASLISTHGKTPAQAGEAFNAAFGYVPDTSTCPRNAPTSGDDVPQRLAGLRAVAFSKLTKDLGLAPSEQSALLAALANDLSDGSLNGKRGSDVVAITPSVSMPADVQNKFERAMSGLMSDTTANHTGLTVDQIGSLPFAKLALSATYKVEYVPGMMPPAAGKTTFKLRITNRAEGTPATGLAVSLMPLMHMSTRNHSTPVDLVVEDSATPGTYNCTAYYLMSSMSSTGMSMGYWELKVMLGTGMYAESVTFYPGVGMSMASNTQRVTLKGQADTIAGMTGPEKRSYFLFRDGIEGATLKLFIAAKQSMMSYPAVSMGSTLTDAGGAAWTVDTMSVQTSTDGSAWVDAVDNGGGHWSASTLAGLGGLGTAQPSTVYVKLTINGEQKTTDGNAAAGTNESGSFTVTP